MTLLEEASPSTRERYGGNGGKPSCNVRLSISWSSSEQGHMSDNDTSNEVEGMFPHLAGMARWRFATALQTEVIVAALQGRLSPDTLPAAVMAIGLDVYDEASACLVDGHDLDTPGIILWASDIVKWASADFDEEQTPGWLLACRCPEPEEFDGGDEVELQYFETGDDLDGMLH